MWNLKTKQASKQIKIELIDTEDRLAEVGIGAWMKWVKGVKRYKLPVIKKFNGDVMHSMVI